LIRLKMRQSSRGQRPRRCLPSRSLLMQTALSQPF